MTTDGNLQNVPLITQKEFEEQLATGKILVTVGKRKIYDVSDFVEAHPGGGDLIMEWNGKDVTEIMSDAVSHEHSENAYELLESDYLVALLATPEESKKLLTDENRCMFKVGNRTSEEELTVQTDFEKDLKAHKFLDLGKPLLLQMLFAKFDKQFYLEQVHKPRHYGQGSAPIFGNFLEPLSKTPWYVVPILWIPVDMFVASEALRGTSLTYFLAVYGAGLFIWTLLEYCMHRFLFHIDNWLPDNSVFLTLHFLLHGVHHYLPMDRLRLVMPPALLIILASPFYKLAHSLFSYHTAQAVFAGGFMGYIMYDVTHYSLHHIRLPAWLKELKTYHLDHHYKNYELGFGVTSKFWDRVFGTELVETSLKRV
jgi:4-hydroxysphinganine ceramide fatty acyl 2-hydroxylase